MSDLVPTIITLVASVIGTLVSVLVISYVRGIDRKMDEMAKAISVLSGEIRELDRRVTRLEARLEPHRKLVEVEE